MEVWVNVVDKCIINGQIDVNQLVLFKYKWVWEKYLVGCVNYWMLQEINMFCDIVLWKDLNGLIEDECCIVKCNFGFFVMVDLFVVNNIVFGMYCYIMVFECWQFLLCQVFEEVIYMYVY